MFWRKKKKKKEEDKPKTAREELIAQAIESARGARERLGDDTIQQIAEALRRKENSATEQAKAKIKAMDQAHVADHIKLMMDEE